MVMIGGIVVVVGMVSFFGGMQYQKGQIVNTGYQNGNFQMMGGNGIQGQRQTTTGGRTGMMGNRANRPVSGEIISADDTSITVKLNDGSSKIVMISNTTQINKASVATKVDLKTGEKVSVFGQTNTDGSVSAQSIQLNPIMMQISGRPLQPTQ